VIPSDTRNWIDLCPTTRGIIAFEDLLLFHFMRSGFAVTFPINGIYGVLMCAEATALLKSSCAVDMKGE